MRNTDIAQVAKAQKHLATLLKKVKLCGKNADSFVCMYNIGTECQITINTLMLHSHCIKQGKYKDNESLKDLVLNKCIEAQLSSTDTNTLLKAIGAEPINEITETEDSKQKDDSR